MMKNTGFAVIDFETTGFSPQKGDKVVEVGLVLLDSQGIPETTFSTLVNPLRDVGPTKIHGITASDVIDAPTFPEIAARLVELLNGRVIVAHNARFDVNFLVAELEKSNISVDRESLPVLCTMQLASEMIPGVGRSLAACCEAYDIDQPNAHSALDDAAATAKLLRSYFDQDPNYRVWDEALDSASEFKWPSLEHIEIQTRDRKSQSPRELSGLAPYISRIPDAATTPEERGLMRLFDDIFSDGLMSSEEADLINAYVKEVRITDQKLEEIKSQYFLELVNVAWSDGELNAAEKAGIRYVGNIFGISPVEVQSKIEYLHNQDENSNTAPEFASFRIHLDEGDFVVLTGEMPLERSHYEGLLANHGILTWPSVTKKVKLVIAQDPNTQSGKANRARLLGVPVVSLEDLLKAIQAEE